VVSQGGWSTYICTCCMWCFTGKYDDYGCVVLTHTSVYFISLNFDVVLIIITIIIPRKWYGVV
jgi:hypothetical protein